MLVPHEMASGKFGCGVSVSSCYDCARGEWFRWFCRSSGRTRGRKQKSKVARTTGTPTLSRKKTGDLVDKPPIAAVKEPMTEVCS